MYVWSKLSSERWRDAWEERFHGLGQTNAVIHELKGGKSVRVEVYCRTKRQAEAIEKEFGGKVRKLKVWNWTQMPAVKAPPIKIRDALLVLPTDDKGRIAQLRKEYPKRELIFIPPEMAFGTGDHVTTATCLRFLVDISRELNRGDEPWDQLDLGCGSGILSIAGRKLGARTATGYDYDERAVEISRRNARRNGTRGVRYEVKDVLSWRPGPEERGAYRCVTANLFSEVLEAIFSKITAVTGPGGHVVISGVLAEQMDSCLAAGEKAGIRFEKVVRGGKWVTARGRVGSPNRARKSGLKRKRK